MADIIRLSQHFTLAEAIRSDKAIELGDANTPTPEHLQNLRVSAYGMECVRMELGGFAIEVTSGYRNQRVNAAAGGVDDSAHALGWAWDFRSKRYAPYEAALRIASSRIPFDQLILETSRSIVHISFDPRLRQETLTQRGDAKSPFVAGIVQ